MKYIDVDIISHESFPEDDIDYEKMGIERPEKTVPLEELQYKNVRVYIGNISYIDPQGDSGICNLYMNSGDILSAKVTLEELEEAGNINTAMLEPSKVKYK